MSVYGTGQRFLSPEHEGDFREIRAQAAAQPIGTTVDNLAADTCVTLARALLWHADHAGMPDTYWRTDSGIKLARMVLNVPEDGRYTHAHLWARNRDGGQ